MKSAHINRPSNFSKRRTFGLTACALLLGIFTGILIDRWINSNTKIAFSIPPIATIAAAPVKVEDAPAVSRPTESAVTPSDHKGIPPVAKKHSGVQLNYENYYKLIGQPDYNLMVRQKQEREVRQRYSNFLKELHLTNSQAIEAIQLLTECKMAPLDSNSSVGTDRESQILAAKAGKSASDQLMDQLSGIIGAQNVAAIKEFDAQYGPNIVARTQIENLKLRLEFTENTISSEQEQQLTKIFATSAAERDQRKLPEKIRTILTPTQMTEYLKAADERRFQAQVEKKYADVRIVNYAE